MSPSKADAILHPIRLRIVMVVMGRELSTQQIAQQLPDVPQASLYRHISRLCAAGVLTVVRENPVRGTLEKVYAVSEQGAALSVQEFAQISREDHLRYFTTFAASLIETMRRYLAQETFDVVADGLTYRTAPLNLSDTEYAEFVAMMRAPVAAALEKKPSPERRRRVLAVVVIPEATDTRADVLESEEGD